MPPFVGRRLAVPMGLLLVVARLAPAEPQRGSVVVTIVSHGSGAGSLQTELEAHLLAGAVSELAEVRERVPGQQPILMRLPSGTWSITARATGHWASEAVVQVTAAQKRRATIHLWPAATLSGRLVVPAEHDLPAQVKAVLQTVPGARRGEAIPETAVSCSLEEARWSCSVPATTIDVELRPRGFISHFWWDVRVPPTATRDVGAVALQKGCAISGRVITADGKVEASGSRVTVLDPGGDPLVAPTTRARPEPILLSAQVNHRGFYQIVGVPAGPHVVAAELAGWARAHRVIHVIPDVQTRVPPLVLERAEALLGEVEPPVHPSGQQWRIQLVRTGPNPGFEGPETPVPKSGRWQRLGLSPGVYWVKVRGPGGATWHHEEVEVPAGSPLRLTIPILRLTGTIRIAASPLKASIVFGGRFGSVRIPMESDEEGRFGGLLPGATDDTPRQWEVYVEAGDPPLRRTLEEVTPQWDLSTGEARVELTLPSGTLKGLVTDERGTPVQALVNVLPLDPPERLVQGRTDAAGQFTLSGLPPGQTLVAAEVSGGASEPLQLMVRGTGDTKVTIVARPYKSLTGRVVSSEGEGVAGAQLRAFPVELPALMAPAARARSDANGYFDLKVPSYTRIAALEVGAVGYAIRKPRIVAGKEPVVVELERYGGTLRLEYRPPPVRTSRTPALYLVDGSGGYTYVQDSLRAWAEANTLFGSEDRVTRRRASTPTGGRVVLEIPQVARGSYALCHMTIAAELRFMREGALPKDCASGRLEPFGTLELSLSQEQ